MDNRFIEKLQGVHPLARAEIAALADATSKPRKVAARSDLIREGDRPGPVFVILDGWVCRLKILPTGQRRVLAFLMPGDCCDLHISLLAEMDHGLQTLTSALVATIDREEIEGIMARHPGVARAMYVSQLIDAGTMRAWITSMGRRTSVERIAHLICELYIRACSVGLAPEGTFALPLSQLLLADALGMTPVHLNRVLGELRLRGALTTRRGWLIMSNPAMLIQIAGFDENYLHRRLPRAA